MKDRLVVDTGVLVAAFDSRDQWAGWTFETLKEIQGPLYCCESVLAETWFLLHRYPIAWEKVLKWLSAGYLQLAFSIRDEQKTVLSLMEKYRDLPMSVADACSVAMIEIGTGDRIFTLDKHFQVYRHSGRSVIPVLMPESGLHP